MSFFPTLNSSAFPVRESSDLYHQAGKCPSDPTERRYALGTQRHKQQSVIFFLLKIVYSFLGVPLGYLKEAGIRSRLLNFSEQPQGPRGASVLEGGEVSFSAAVSFHSHEGSTYPEKGCVSRAEGPPELSFKVSKQQGWF